MNTEKTDIEKFADEILIRIQRITGSKEIEIRILPNPVRGMELIYRFKEKIHINKDLEKQLFTIENESLFEYMRFSGIGAITFAHPELNEAVVNELSWVLYSLKNH
jgi:hypothetical protein